MTKMNGVRKLINKNDSFVGNEINIEVLFVLLMYRVV